MCFLKKKLSSKKSIFFQPRTFYCLIIVEKIKVLYSIYKSSLTLWSALHYGLTGGWVQKCKASYLGYFLQCALTDYVSGKA